MADDGASDTVRELKDKARSVSDDVEVSDSYETVARAGYAAKGLVYAVIGVLAFLAAMTSFGVGSGGQTSGTSEALRFLDQGMLGRIVLALVALGLIGYVLWRFVQAFVDPENVSDEDGGMLKRGLYFVSGLAYTLLAVRAVQLVLDPGSGGGGGSSGGTQSMTETLLQQPFGQWLVGAVALAIAARGIMQARKAYKSDFFENLRYTEELSHRTVRRIGQVGLSARAGVFLMVAGFLVWAALDENSRHARGLEGSLDTLAGMTGGPWLLAAAGIGLVAYGLFQGIKARYRVIG
jgi:hypothetical protein